MKPRRVYFRKKGKSVILEGRDSQNKPINIWTLPEANKFILQIIENASFLPMEKREQIKEKYTRLALKPESEKNRLPKVPSRKIKRI